MYYIKKVSLFTENGVESPLLLEPGLNIIYGESNTGKSLVVDCIDYMFGASEHRFDAKLRIKSIMLLIDVDGSSLTMRRDLDSNEVEVSSSVEFIDSDTYKIGNAKKSINSVWLQLLGIEDEVKIIQTLEGKPQRLTLRTFYHLLLIDEQRIDAVNSILSSGIGYNKKVSTPVLSALIYLATGNNFLPDKASRTKNTRAERRDAVRSFVDRSMEQLSTRCAAELETTSLESPFVLQKKIDALLDEISAAEGVLDSAIAESKSLADKILGINSQLSECKVLYNRNDALLSQYESDIRRLTFIAEGDIHDSKTRKLKYCPFCNGELSKIESESCIDSAIAEMDKIETQISDLHSVQEAIISERRELEELKATYLSERKTVEATIRGELRPRIQVLRDNLADYTRTLNQYKAKEMVATFNDVLISELKVTELEESESLKIDVRAKFTDVFYDGLNEVLKQLLEYCNYQHFSSVRFDMDDYDVVVNGHLKKSQGKGFRAFLNTILAIAVQICLEESNKYAPRLLVIDSPILSLKEKEDNVGDEHASETMKSGLFRYMINNQNSRQTIIIENELPPLDYSQVHLIEFTKDETRGRYGLIDGYRE